MDYVLIDIFKLFYVYIGITLKFIKIYIKIRNIAEVLIGFDIDCCSVGYNGTTVYAIPRSRRAINSKCKLIKNSFKINKK